jgi:hypothetical protein
VATSYVEGRYLAEVLDQGFGQSEVKHTDYFYLTLKVLGRYDLQGQLQACPQHVRTYQQFLANETGINILFGDLKAIGVEIADLTQLYTGAPDYANLVGRQIHVCCALETYAGKERERWSIFRPRRKLDLDAVRALNERFRQSLRGGGESNPPAGASGSDPGNARQ